MPRQELHTNQLPNVEQRPIITGDDPPESDVVLVDRIEDGAYLDDLAFMEEPLTIRLEPSNDANAATSFPVWVNGTMAEVLMNGRWLQMGYLPVGQVLTVKRKVVEVLVRAKIDTVHTRIVDRDSDRPGNVVERRTSPVHSFSIIEDRNPRGAAWLTEMRRRNF